jgi:hypothetical protein
MVQVRLRLIRVKQDFAPDLIHVNSGGGRILFYLDTAQAHPAPLLITMCSGLARQSCGAFFLWSAREKAAELDESKRPI